MNYEYELYHHGVKGMKWGVRRQNVKRKDKQFKEDVKHVKKNLAYSTVDFYNERASQRGKEYVNRVYNRAVMEVVASASVKAAGVAAVGAILYKLSK